MYLSLQDEQLTSWRFVCAPPFSSLWGKHDKNPNIDMFSWSSLSGISSNLMQFLVSDEGLLLFSVTFMLCSLCADKIRNFWREFLYEFCLFRCLFATCTDSFALLQFRCGFINTRVVIKCWELVTFPCQGEGCCFYPLLSPQNFPVFITLFLLPQTSYRKETGSCIYRSDIKNPHVTNPCVIRQSCSAFQLTFGDSWGIQGNPGCSGSVPPQNSAPVFPLRGFRTI